MHRVQLVEEIVELLIPLEQVVQCKPDSDVRRFMFGNGCQWFCYKDYPMFGKLLLVACLSLASNAESERRFSIAKYSFYSRKNQSLSERLLFKKFIHSIRSEVNHKIPTESCTCSVDEDQP